MLGISMGEKGLIFLEELVVFYDVSFYFFFF